MRKKSLELDQAKVDHLKTTEKKARNEAATPEARAKRDLIIKKFEAYDRAVPGVDTSKLREKLRKDGDIPSKLDEYIELYKKIGLSEYKKRLKESGAFSAPGAYGKILAKEARTLTKMFEDADFLDGEYSQLNILIGLDDTLKAKNNFTDRYKELKDDSRRLFDQVLDSLDPFGSKMELANDIQKINEFKDTPNLIKSEFKKRSKTIKEKKDLTKLKEKLIEEFNTMRKDYKTQVLENKKYFGGSTAEEFMTWYENDGTFKNFEAMKAGLKQLPSEIKKRKAVHEKLEKLYAELPAKETKEFKKYTDNEGLSERKAFIENILIPASEFGKLLEARCLTVMLSAKINGKALYSKEEEEFTLSMLKDATKKEKKAILSAEKVEAKKRVKIAKDYLRLPNHIRKDKDFFEANASTRQEMLIAAQQKAARMANESNPFTEFNNEELLTAEQIRNMKDGLESHAGTDLIRAAYENEVNENKQRSLNLVKDFINMKSRDAMESHNRKKTQEDLFMDEFIKYKDELTHEKFKNGGKTEKDQSLVAEANLALEQYHQGNIILTSSRMESQRIVKDTDIEKGIADGDASSIDKAMNVGSYASGIKVENTRNSNETDLGKTIGTAVDKALTKMMPEIISGIMNQLQLSGINQAKMKNVIDENVIKDTIGREQLGEAANNMRHFNKAS